MKLTLPNLKIEEKKSQIREIFEILYRKLLRRKKFNERYEKSFILPNREIGSSTTVVQLKIRPK